MKIKSFSTNLSYMLLLLSFSLFSCKKFLQIDPPTNQISNPLPFQDDAVATSTVLGIYSEMMRSSNQFSNNCTTLFAGMSADELYYYSPSFRDEFVANQISQANHSNLTLFFWQPAYKYIYAANLCIEQLSLTNLLSPNVKKSLVAECKFIRAFCFFYLTNLFGDIPLPITSNYNVTATLPRSAKAEVYSQIVNDLKEAQASLSEVYPTAERVRPNKWAVTAILARVYLYLQDWTNAETQAGTIINSGTYTLEANLNNVFLKGSTEAIWQLKPVNPTYNTFEGNAILQPTPSQPPSYLLQNTLLNGFELGDQRKVAWVGSRVFSSQLYFFPFKYKVYGSNAPLTEYYMVCRLAEQYLIRAEARAHLNNISGSKSDLDVIRARAGLIASAATDQSSLLVAIEQERRIELFAEWGHRWFDLKRNGRADAVISALKATWQPTDALWPIPQDQINLNPNLVQNPGY